MFVIEDEKHAEIDFKTEYETFDLALAEIRRRVALPWDIAPNVAPCMSWRTCGRFYAIGEYDTTTTPYTCRKVSYIVKIDAAGVEWRSGFAPE
jgi:hypothetical protein